METPPPSIEGHRRLHSIDNDDWTEREGIEKGISSDDTLNVADSNNRTNESQSNSNGEQVVPTLPTTLSSKQGIDNPNFVYSDDEGLDVNDLSSVFSAR
jgi:hypothetical protein